MQSIKIFTENPDLGIEKYMISATSFAPIEFYYFLSDYCGISPKPNCLYIGTSKQINELCSKYSHDFLIHCIATDWNEKYINAINHNNINLFYIPMEPFSIYNALNNSLGAYQYWLRVFTAPAGKTLSFILENASKMLHSSIFVFNSCFSLIGKVLFSENDAGNAYSFTRKQFLSTEDIKEIEDNSNILFLPIKSGVSTYAYALLFKTDQNHRSVRLLIDLFVEVLSSHLSEEISSKMSQSIQLEQFIRDMIELKIQSRKEIKSWLSQIQMKQYNQTFCIVIQPNHTNIAITPLNYIISRLNVIFPSGRFCIYSDSIVGMLGSDDFNLPNHDSSAFNTLLLQYEAYAGISNPTKHLEFFNVFYTMAKAALQYGTIFPDTDSQRIFHYENYRLYHMVDLCKESFKRRYHHDNFIYLCHPAIITLYQYDQKHKTDYFNIIYTYLSNGCNIVQSAQVLNYHRNTLQNKLSRIKKIIGLSLDSAVLNSTLFFSCIVIKYFIEYEHRNILDYSADGPENTDI